MPVLSTTSVSTFERADTYFPPFITTPLLADIPSAAVTASGIDTARSSTQATKNIAAIIEIFFVKKYTITPSAITIGREIFAKVSAVSST